MRDIYDKLTPVRMRQKMASVARSAAWCLLATACIAVALAIASSLVGVPHLRLAGWIVLASGPLVGIAIAFLSRDSWSAAARAVDRHFRLDDRVQSAVAFLETGKTSGLYALQVGDTVERLSKLDTKSAVRLRVSKSGGASIVCAIIAAALLMMLPEHEQRPIADKTDVSPVDKPTAASPETQVQLPTDVYWEPANNDRIIRQPAGAAPTSPPVAFGEAAMQLHFDEQIDDAYAPMLDKPQ